MGLDAAVFFNEKNLPAHLGPHMYEREEETGDYLTHEGFDYLHSDFMACHYRLTNMGGAGGLRELLRAQGLEDDSVLLKQVLYSGTHCGDYIPMADLPRLEAEIAAAKPHAEERLRDFLDEMTALTEVARREGNPIVFV